MSAAMLAIINVSSALLDASRVPAGICEQYDAEHAEQRCEDHERGNLAPGRPNSHAKAPAPSAAASAAIAAKRLGYDIIDPYSLHLVRWRGAVKVKQSSHHAALTLSARAMRGS